MAFSVLDETGGIPDPHYAAVGKVASSWALFETLLDITVWRFSNIDPKIMACVTSQVSGSGRKLDAVISLIRHIHGDAAVAPFNKFSEQTQRLAERRNRIVHDAWLIKDGVPSRIEFTARKRVVVEAIAVDTVALTKLTEEIVSHIEKLEVLLNPMLPPLGL
jgi:hypothetical protein